jgi:predicted transcriptional regulator
MATLRVHLSEKNSERADKLARRVGKSPEALVIEAFERYLAEVDPQETGDIDWKAALMQAAGIWKDRDDLPDFDEVRRSMARCVWR